MTTMPTADDTHELVFLVRTELNEGKAEALRTTLPAHLEFLKQQYAADHLLFGGPLVDGDLHNTGNGLYALRAESIDAATTLANADPLHRDGVRTAHVDRWMLKTDYSR
ncbi:YciI family protein [Mycobacterium sp. AT1]|uniref:YciI family protein n=1 Tax=Mycobacterium sp. AT1 TaxID=1961706 RepID=UPI0009AC31E2|nr:YciI family protein [Mycobacterium sp. AT1]OPX05809.1 hypothetical protein B1790_30835 [Mycobacterium sp. AT1]